MISAFLFASATSIAMAQAQTPQPYTVLAPLPGTTIDANCTGTACTSDLSHYLPGIFNLMIGVAAVAAFVAITIGGFEYMFTDVPGVKASAKGMVSNAFWGLGFIIFAYAILNTINPVLLKGSLNITPPTVASGGGLTTGTGGATTNVGGNIAGVAMTTDQQTASDAVRAALKSQSGGVVTAYADPCTRGQTTGCVDLNGLTPSTQNGLELLGKNCGSGCKVVISGGTEAGHSTGSDHNKGNGVDIEPNAQLTNAVTNNLSNDPSICKAGAGGTCNGLAACNKYTTSVGGQTATYLWEPTGSTCGGNVPSSAPHWHASF